MTSREATLKRCLGKRTEVIHKAISAGFSESVVPGLFDLIVAELAEEPEAIQSKYLSFGHLTLDLDTHQAEYAGKPANLTVIEFRLARLFLSSPGKLLTHQSILREIWGLDQDCLSQQLLRVYIGKLRNKTAPDFVKTRAGEGYYLPLNT